jgi:quercetin dioxygenase-like cupin family protein
MRPRPRRERLCTTCDANLRCVGQSVIELINAGGVRVAEFELPPRTDGRWHHHSQVSEYCYCLKGRLVIEIDVRAPATLEAGDRCEIAAGVRHRVRNVDALAARYLVVQGVRRYDFVTTAVGDAARSSTFGRRRRCPNSSAWLLGRPLCAV